VFTPLAVALDVDDDALTLGEILAEHDVGHGLQGTQGLTPPPDQPAQVAAADIERDRFGAGAHGDLRADAHVLEEPFDQSARGFGFAVGGRCGTCRCSRLVDDNDLHQRLFGTFADHAHVHVPTAFTELDQRRVDGFVEGTATALCRSHRTSTPSRISSLTISLTSCASWTRLRVAEMA
jgi:hypothetical protein